MISPHPRESLRPGDAAALVFDVAIFDGVLLVIVALAEGNVVVDVADAEVSMVMPAVADGECQLQQQLLWCEVE